MGSNSTHLFGEHLKREREMRGVSLEEISAATRISVRFLEALENEQWERLPGGIFNRGFIRSIARFLGMDEEGLVAEYALETRERPEIAVWTKEPIRKRPNWTAISGTIGVAILLIVGVWYVHQRYGAGINAWRSQHPVFKMLTARFRHTKPAPPTNSSSSPLDSSPGGRSNVIGAAPEKTQQPVASQDAATAPSSQPSKNIPNANPATPNASASSKPGATPAAAPPPRNPAAPPGLMELKVEAGETSNVTVLADGKVAFSGKLEALRTLTLHAQESFTVSSTKSSAVLLELNGHTVPPLGPPGEPGKITLTRDNLKSNPGDED